MNNQVYNGFNQELRGFYKASVVKSDTNEIVWEQPEWKNNLILNQGMDQIYTSALVDLMTYAVAGLGSRPNSVDGGSSEITQSGANVYLNVRTGLADFTSATSTYAAAVQVGDMLKYANNSESRVTTVTDAYNLVVTPSYTFTVGQTFDVWKTSQVGLELEASRSTSYLGGSGYCGSTTVGNVVTHRRTYDFPIETSAASYNEAGVAWAAAVSPTNVFSRFLLAPAVEVGIGFKLRIAYDLQSTWLPSTPQYKTASIGGWPVSPSTNQIGTESIQKLLTSTVQVADGASLHEDAMLDPYFISHVSATDNRLVAWTSPSSATLAAFGSSVDRSTNAAISPVVSKAAYAGAGSHYCDKSALFDISLSNRTDLRSIGLGNYWSSPAYSNQVYCFVFDQPQAKDSSQTLSLTFRWTWTRTLA